jgi:hypothetical protein
MKIFRLSLLALVTLAFSLRPTKITESTCAGGDFEPYAYNLFKPIPFSELTDFWRKPDLTEDANLKDWLAYLKDKPKLDDVREVVYKLSADDMQKVRAFVSNGANIPAAWQKNSLIKYWQGNKDIEAIDYLFYAKACEAQAGTFDDWQEGTRDLSKVKWLADAGKQYYKEKASNDFLKLRFAYQAIRMAHYSEQYQKGIAFYEELVKPLEAKTESPIKYWALAHKAGCLMRAGKEAEANYLFAQVFDKCPSKRVSSALSWSVENENTWKSAIAFCQNPQEKASMHFVRAVSDRGDLVAEMKNIYENAPDYDKLYALLLMQINDLENALMQVDLDNNLWFLGKTASPTATEEAVVKLRKTQEFVTKCVAEGKVQKKELFGMASGYLDFVAGKSAQALKKLDDLAKQTKETVYLSQIEICKTAIQIATLPKVDEAAETELFNTVQKLNNERLTTFMWRVFEKLYIKQNEVGKASLCWRGDMLYKPNLAHLDQLIALADKKKKTPLEQKILNNLSEKNAKAYLLEVKATYLFSQDKLQEATALYDQVPADMIQKIGENPLAFSIPHYVTYPDAVGKNKYDRKTLAYKAMNLKKMAETPNVDQAQQYFQLGCIYYNITYFGNSWEAIDYFRSNVDIQAAQDAKMREGSFINLDCSKAKFYFEKAMNVALKDQNKELGAQAAYMAAKCEQNQYYLTQKDAWGFIEPSYKPEHRRYFAALKKDFSDTKYYKEILRECTYFNTFLSRK